MECLIPVNKGTEDVCVKEVLELIKKKAEKGNEYCFIKNVSTKQIAQLTYGLQSGKTVLPLIARAKKIEELQLTNNELFAACMSTETTFAVRTLKSKEVLLGSAELEEIVGEKIGGWLIKKGIPPKVSLSNPDITFLVVAIKGEYFVGIDVVGFSLCKRPYKLFQHATSLNACIAYSIARLSGVTKNNIVVDPFCGTGVIPIEVALFQQDISSFHFENKFAGGSIPFFSNEFAKVTKKKKEKKAKKSLVFGFDAQLRMMHGAKQNAKIAGIKESLSFSKVAVDWVDAKFEKGDVDVIITQPPLISARTKNEKMVLKLYDELCHQAKYLLNKKGTLGVFVNHPEKIKDIAKKHKLSFKKEFALPLGDSTFTLVLFSP